MVAGFAATDTPLPSGIAGIRIDGGLRYDVGSLRKGRASIRTRDHYVNRSVPLWSPVDLFVCVMVNLGP